LPGQISKGEEPGEPRRHTLRRNPRLPDATALRLPLAAVVVEGRYSAAVQAGARARELADQVARLEVRYPEVHVVFADSCRYAEEWTYRFLSSALAARPALPARTGETPSRRSAPAVRPGPQRTGLFDPYTRSSGRRRASAGLHFVPRLSTCSSLQPEHPSLLQPPENRISRQIVRIAPDGKRPRGRLLYLGEVVRRQPGGK